MLLSTTFENAVVSALLSVSLVHSSDHVIGTMASGPTITISKATNPNENYAPRRLYPGTYGEFCGPTPEVQVKQACAAHGWHSDNPIDRVDESCRLHDISYCQCESDLLSRRKYPLEDIPLLSSITALRFATKPALGRVAPVDDEYFKCINKADRQLISKGIQVRGEMQRSACSVEKSLSWFCDLGRGTLDAFERVNLEIFLRDLDQDYSSKASSSEELETTSLVTLEQRRQLDLQKELQGGKNLADAASSDSVREDEQKILEKLLEKL